MIKLGFCALCSVFKGVQGEEGTDAICGNCNFTQTVYGTFSDADGTLLLQNINYAEEEAGRDE